jgi:outer membrane protein assembly factor BamB
VLASATIDGAEKKLVVTSGKHGYVVAVDRETGEMIWKTAVGKHQNDEVDASELPGPDEDALEVYPGTYGGVESPFAVTEDAVYVPVYNLSTFWWSTGSDSSKSDFTRGTGEFVKLDLATGDIVWDIEEPTGILGGAAIANDIAISGGIDGIVRVYNTTDGSKAWTYQLGAGINAPVAIAGDTLFVVAGGLFFPSSETAEGTEPANELVAFRLGAAPAATPSA